MERKSCLIGLTIFLLPPIIFFLYLLINSFIPKVNTYCIPQVDMYVKTIHKNKEVYILFGKDSVLQLNDSIDYLKLNADPFGDSFIIDNSNKTIYVIDRYTHLKKTNSVNFKFVRLTEIIDTIYVKHDSINKTENRDMIMVPITNHRDTFWLPDENKYNKLKCPYLYIYLGDYLQPPMTIFNYDDEEYVKIYPLKSK